MKLIQKNQSNQSKAKQTSIIQIGCSRLNPSEYAHSDQIAGLSEIDLLEYASWSGHERRHLHRRIQAGHQVIGSCSSAFFSKEDREASRIILEELCGDLQVSQLIIRIQRRHLNLVFPRYSFVQIFLDHPKLDRNPHPSSTAKYSPRVWDPLWDPSAPETLQSGVLVKVHGWHDGRWIRRYSEDQIQDCIHQVQKSCSLIQGDIPLLLAHSQRRQQLREFQNALLSVGVIKTI